MFQEAFFIQPDSRTPRYFLKRLEEGERREDRGRAEVGAEIAGRAANYVVIVTAGQWYARKMIPRGFIARIYPGFRRTVYNRKLIFPGIFRQLSRIMANGIFKGFPRWRVYRLRCPVDYRFPVRVICRSIHVAQEYVYLRFSLLSLSPFPSSFSLENYSLVVTVYKEHERNVKPKVVLHSMNAYKSVGRP